MGRTQTMTDCFIAGIRALRDHRWTGKQQKDIAKEIGYTESHLAQVFNGRREPGVGLQEKLASAYGMHAEDVIRIGRGLLEGKGFLPFIGQIDHFPPHSEEQARAIVDLTMKQYGLEGRLMGYRPKGWEDFIESKITAGQFHDLLAAELEDVIRVLRGKG